MGTIGYGYGSEWQLLNYLGRRRAAFTKAVQRVTGLDGIQWLDGEASPAGGRLKVGEHKGLGFLSASDLVRAEWESQWPQTGNVHNWDAVGHTSADSKDVWLLVEAKAHLGEMRSSCAASSASLATIRGVLDRTRLALCVTAGGDLTQDYERTLRPEFVRSQAAQL